ncbi:MAG: hypothetical protein VXZ18_03565 [Pseudomonadota bacterium]|nr:hypothetical protein [Pseudomonadota bacterium]
MILQTAKQHFDEDIHRANAILEHAFDIECAQLKGDILRSAWMTAVGASDAFFCDAYADLVTRTLRAKEREPHGDLRDKLNNLKVPVVAVLNTSNGWRWRMAAREIIEKENVLSIKQIKDLLNIFCRDGHKLLTQETIESWILHESSLNRLFGMSRSEYNQKQGQAKNKAKKSALDHLTRRMQTIFQRRHDCIHNCDRPKIAIQRISYDMTRKAIEDVDFVVNRCTDHLRNEFSPYLTSRGFSGATRNFVGAKS